MLLRNSRVALIDFGTVGSMEKEYHQKFELLVRAMAGQDYAKSADILLLLSGALMTAGSCGRCPRLDRTLGGAAASAESPAD